MSVCSTCLRYCGLFTPVKRESNLQCFIHVYLRDNLSQNVVRIYDTRGFTFSNRKLPNTKLTKILRSERTPLAGWWVVDVKWWSSLIWNPHKVPSYTHYGPPMLLFCSVLPCPHALLLPLLCPHSAKATHQSQSEVMPSLICRKFWFPYQPLQVLLYLYE